MSDTMAEANAPRTRRALLAAAAGAAAAATATALSRPFEAAAAAGDPLTLGQSNESADPTTLDGQLVISGPTANTAQVPAVEIAAHGTGTGHMALRAISDIGTSVRAESFGPFGPNSAAVYARAHEVNGHAVVAIAPAEGMGLLVQGRTHFSRSGQATVTAGKSYVDVDLSQKGGFGYPPLCFANLTTYRPGVFVTAVRPKYPVAGKMRIYLNRAVTRKSYVAWLVLN
jgi:hypothetical protein